MGEEQLKEQASLKEKNQNTKKSQKNKLNRIRTEALGTSLTVSFQYTVFRFQKLPGCLAKGLWDFFKMRQHITTSL